MLSLGLFTNNFPPPVLIRTSTSFLDKLVNLLFSGKNIVKSSKIPFSVYFASLMLSYKLKSNFY